MTTGAVGIEMAAELKLAQPHVKVTLVHSRDKLMSAEGLPDSCKDKALELLLEGGVNVLLEHRMAKKNQDLRQRWRKWKRKRDGVRNCL